MNGRSDDGVGDDRDRAGADGDLGVDAEEEREQRHQEHPAAEPEHAAQDRRDGCRPPERERFTDIHE